MSVQPRDVVDRSATEPGPPPVEQFRYNLDLLLGEGDVERAKRVYPHALFVLDHSELRAVFRRYDVPANAAKRRSAGAGLLAIGLALLGLLIAAASPAYISLARPWPQLFAIVAAALSIASLLIAWVGVLHGPAKQEWLHNRLFTERLRQFHFQCFLRLFPDIQAAVSSGNHEPFLEARKTAFEAFLWRHEGRSSAELSAVLREGTERLWLLAESETERKGDTAADEVLKAYREVRIGEQLQYASQKLKPDGNLFNQPVKQRKFFGGAADFFLVAMFILYIATALLIAASLLYEPSAAIAAIVQSPITIVVGTWVAGLAIGFRALKDGLCVDREIERYAAYEAAMLDCGRRFDNARSTDEKLRVMEDVERTVFEEMRAFLRTHHASNFVM